MKLSMAAMDDLLWWYRFSRIFNGKAAISNPTFAHPLVSDASSKGFGVYLGGQWLAGVWPHIPPLNFPPPCKHAAPPP